MMECCIEDRRVYVTSVARTSNGAIETDIPSHMSANEGNFECQSYSITSSNYDALFSFSNF